MERTTQRQVLAGIITSIGILLLIVCLCAIMMDWQSICPGRTSAAAAAFIVVGVMTNARQERHIKSKGHR